MYDIYGFPGFLAAYNAGPGRLDDYLTRNRPLPDETRNYVRKIAPYIVGITPNRPSAADSSRHEPVCPWISRRGRATRITTRRRWRWPRTAIPGRRRSARCRPRPGRAAAAGAAAAAAGRPARAARVRAAPHAGFHLIAPAMADTLPAQRVSGASTVGKWAIQVGAYGNESQARAAADTARSQAHDLLAQCPPGGGHSALLQRHAVSRPGAGLSRDAAVQACEKLGHRGGCIVLSPETQGYGCINGRSWLSLPCRGADIYNRN